MIVITKAMAVSAEIGGNGKRLDAAEDDRARLS